jgi:hypothetical protein
MSNPVYVSAPFNGEMATTGDPVFVNTTGGQQLIAAGNGPPGNELLSAIGGPPLPVWIFSDTVSTNLLPLYVGPAYEGQVIEFVTQRGTLPLISASAP